MSAPANRPEAAEAPKASATQTHVEIEAKYDLTDGAPLPELTGVGGVDAAVAQPPLVLTASYFDTPAHALASAGATLRRRTGGTDDGWHLKLPLADGERLEVHRPLGAGKVPPAALTALVRAIVRSDPVAAVATLVTRRTVHNLTDGDGRVLAELADDTVTGERHDVESPPLTWRELEIELVDGDRELLAALDEAVRAAGVTRAAGASKVGRVLGASAARASQDPGFRRGTPVGVVLDAAVQQAVGGLQAADPLLRLDRPDAPARMRTAVRRVRAAVALRRQALPDGTASSTSSELTWLDSVVAGVEQLDETRTRIHHALAAEPKKLVLGPVARRVDRELRATRRTALGAVREALDSPRYLELLDGLVRLPTQDAAGGGRAGAVLRDLADRALRRAERQLRQLGRVAQLGADRPDGPDDDEDPDRRRAAAARAVDRARYAQSLVPGRKGPTHARLAATLDEVGAVLSQLDAGARSQEMLRDLAAQAQEAGESGFTFGRLHGLEQMHAWELHRRLRALGQQVKGLRKALSG